MAGLISTLFFFFLCALFYLIGLPFRPMLKGFVWEKTIIVPSSCGLALASLTVTLGYKLGLSPQLMFWLLIGFGLFCLGNAFVGRRQPIAPAPRTRKIYT